MSVIIGNLNGLKLVNDAFGHRRILAIADAYEVMTTGRPYRRAVPREKAVEEIRRNAGTQCDPHLDEVFLAVINSDKAS